MFDLTDKYKTQGMKAYVELQNQEFDSENRGYTATKHQRVGTGYFDSVLMAITPGGNSSTAALAGSTEEGSILIPWNSKYCIYTAAIIVYGCCSFFI